MQVQGQGEPWDWFPMALTFGGLSVPPWGCKVLCQWEHMFCPLLFYLAKGMQEFDHPESSVLLPSWAWAVCHDADILVAPIG